MRAKLATFVSILMLSSPVFSHSGHTSAPHIHHTVEFFLLGVAITVILYRLFKKY